MPHSKSLFQAWLMAWAWGLAALVATQVVAAQAISLVHVHGLSYSADGKQLMIPSHHGLAIYANGRWTKAAGPAHDYMGYSATHNALYSSGHPAPSSGLSNPLGLIKSRDGGQTWQQLGLSGESDFHTLATSYATNAVYVVNPAANSRMSQAGIYASRDDGLKWTHSPAQGLGSKLNSLAVHPTEAAIVAAGTDEGLYLSHNSAHRFDRLLGAKGVLAVFFDLDGQHLWFSSLGTKAELARISLKAGAKAEPIALPAMPDDGLAYIAQNPVRPHEMAIASFNRSVFISKNRGLSWTAIAIKGTTLE
ncbi:MAG: glycosyl hydrolase [Burkholderiaceae bacterium]